MDQFARGDGMRDADASANADESESDDDRGLRKQALAVDGEPDYSTGPPMDGFEYLRRVAFEAKQTPDIMRATNLDLSAFEAGEAAVSSTREDEEIEYAPPSWATPDREWVRRTVGDFSELRVRVSRAIAGRLSTSRGAYPSNGDKRAWERACEDETEPSLGAVLVMDAVVCAHLLRYTARGLLLYDFDGDVDVDDLIRRLRWFHALSARVELPLDADTEASVRSAMKGVARGRLSLRSADDELLPHLNLAIAIGGGYFKQWRGA